MMMFRAGRFQFFAWIFWKIVQLTTCIVVYMRYTRKHVVDCRSCLRLKFEMYKRRERRNTANMYIYVGWHLIIKVDPYCQQQKCSAKTLVSGGIRFMRIFAVFSRFMQVFLRFMYACVHILYIGMVCRSHCQDQGIFKENLQHAQFPSLPFLTFPSIHFPSLPFPPSPPPPPFSGDPWVHPRKKIGIRDARRWVLEQFGHKKNQHRFLNGTFCSAICA